MRLVLALLLGSLLSMGWNQLSRRIMSWHEAGVSEFKNPQVVAETILQQATRGRGIYSLPRLAAAPAQETLDQTAARENKFASAMADGPYLYAMIRPGRALQSAGSWWSLLLRGLLVTIGLAMLVRLLPLPKLALVGCCAALAAVGSFASMSSMALWLEWPWPQVSVAVADQVIEWTVVGALLSWLLGRSPTVHDRH